MLRRHIHFYGFCHIVNYMFYLPDIGIYLASALIMATLLMWIAGWMWERKTRYPALKDEEDKISVVIASYKSAATIRETIDSVIKADYRNKEIIVVDDTPDKSVVKACEGLPVKIIRKKERVGKARSLNRALKDVKTDLFLFLDSDSVIDKSFIKNLASWFSDRKVGAVSPRFDTKNRTGLLRKFTSLESSFWFTLAKTHMFFGSMISFRGCGFMVRASAFRKVGGWDETLTEDVALAGKLIKHGYKIDHDPRSVVLTEEPYTLKEFYRQRFRWGKGGFFAFMRNKTLYIKSPQIMIGMLPHAMLLAGLIMFFGYQSISILLAAMPIYVLYTMSFTKMIEIASALAFLMVINYSTAATVSSPHTIMFSFMGVRNAKEIALLVPYALVYMPVLFAIYTIGMLAGAKERIRNGKGCNELNMKDWKK